MPVQDNFCHLKRMCASLNKSNKWIFIWKSIWCAEEAMQELGGSSSFCGRCPMWPCTSHLLCLHNGTRCRYLLEWWILHRQTVTHLSPLENVGRLSSRKPQRREPQDQEECIKCVVPPLTPSIRHFLFPVMWGGGVLFQLNAFFPSEDNNCNL